MEEDIKKECSIIVSSCDAYSDVWPVFFTLFFRYWTDCPFKIYLVSETKKYHDNRVITINIGEDNGWATNMKRAITKINTPYLLFFVEDLLLQKKINNEKIVRLLKIMIKEKAGCLKLEPSPFPDKKFKNYQEIGEISKERDYSVSLLAGFWNKKIFDSLIKEGETAWQMEIEGSKRAQTIEAPFLSTYDKPLKIVEPTAIKKGIWLREAVKFCRGEGVLIDRSKRTVETRYKYFMRVIKRFPIVGRIASMFERKDGLKNFYLKIKEKIFLFSTLKNNLILIITKSIQIINFYSQRKYFFEIYDLIKKENISKFITPHWVRMNSNFENYLRKNGIPFSFLRNRTIGYTMFVSGGGKSMDIETEFLEGAYKKEDLRAYLNEEAVGFPILMNKKYATSHNTIHHLYHIALFLRRTKGYISSINTVVEWGGGYGNLAKIFLRVRGNSAKTTYIIIDTPLFSSLQWLYLSVVLGKDRVNIIKNIDDEIATGKINIVPLGFVNKVNVKPDLFVSTWALSESSAYSQDYVLNKDFFGSKHLLIAYQESNEYLPDAGRLANFIMSREKEIIQEKIDFLPKNYYIFR